MQPEYSSSNFHFRLECENALKKNFLNDLLTISVRDDPPKPTVTPPTLKVKEGTAVTMKCSAPAPCQSRPPTLSWTPGLGDSQESTEKNEDETEVKTSVLTFTASQSHHTQEISCTAVYSKEDGSTETSVSTSLTADISYSPKGTKVSVSPSGPVPEDSIITLTCSSAANPAVRSYSWYRVNGGQNASIGTGHVLNITVSKVSGSFFCTAKSHLGVGKSDISHIDVQFAPQILPSSDCTKTADQLNCSCETVGNPRPAVHWYLDGSPVSHSDKFAISKESLNDTGVTSSITVKLQGRDLSTLSCHSSNSVGQRLHVYSFGMYQLLGPYGEALLLSAVAISLSVNVLCTIFMLSLWKSRKSLKPTEEEEDRTYMSLYRRDGSPEYGVIGQAQK